MIFDTHAHYDDMQFDPDRQELLDAMQQHGIGTIVNVSSDLPSWEKTIALTQAYSFVYGALGMHPSELEGLNEETFLWLGEHLRDEKIVALGEIGLDYYWEKEPDAIKNQKYWFRRQLDLAREQKMPVIIHSRDAAQDTYEILKDYTDLTLNIHCYSYSPEMAQRFVEMGCYFGIGGVLTFKNSRKLKETAAMLPMDKILLETDCPYLAPVPYRGKRNSSKLLPYVVTELAQIRGISEQEVIDITEENAKRFYDLL